jgi:hypothetical protein
LHHDSYVMSGYFGIENAVERFIKCHFHVFFPIPI